MSNDELWHVSIETASREFAGLDQQLLERTAAIVSEMMTVKSRIAMLFDGVNGGEICRLCRGECCQSGSYHFTVTDLLAYLVTGDTLFAPRFDSGVCPYLGEGGCVMSPSFRPYNCVTFVCDRVDAGMTPEDRERFAELSAGLRDLYQRMEALFENRFFYGILNNGRRLVEGRSTGILRSGDGNN